ncbi:hypothetical protein F5Y04DRAFT_290280 [Hypomontagnella monticulosa]|nr:hypothetical protein F5Y04DRAFT_290280 [Hypomontagnella monticulosa]
MARPRKDGRKPNRKAKQRYAAKKQRLRDLMPRIGFDFRDKRCQAMLASVDSGLIRDHIRTFTTAPKLSKALVDQALAVIFESATANMENNPEEIADTTPPEYWARIRETIPWATNKISGCALFSLVVALLSSHTLYDDVNPYEKEGHRYGRLANAVRNFSLTLWKYHNDNYLITVIYHLSEMGLDPEWDMEMEKDDEDDENGGDEDDGYDDEDEGDDEEEDDDDDDSDYTDESSTDSEDEEPTRKKLRVTPETSPDAENTKQGKDTKMRREALAIRTKASMTDLHGENTKEDANAKPQGPEMVLRIKLPMAILRDKGDEEELAAQELSDSDDPMDLD